MVSCLGDAVGHAQRAVNLLPKSTIPQTAALLEDTLGWAQYKAGQIDDAIKTLEASIEKAELAPNKMHLGVAYLAKGDKKQAEEHLDRAKELAGIAKDTAILQQTEKWLSQLN